METITKLSINRLKTDIKILADEQKFLKNQRKTVHIIGNRKIPANEANWIHSINRHRLRLLYAAYGIIRGRIFSTIETNYSEKKHPLSQFNYNIHKIVDSYNNIK